MTDNEAQDELAELVKLPLHQAILKISEGRKKLDVASFMLGLTFGYTDAANVLVKRGNPNVLLPRTAELAHITSLLKAYKRREDVHPETQPGDSLN